MQHKPLEPHIWSRAQLQVQTDRLAHLECAFHIRLEVPTHGPGAMVGEELEDVLARSLRMVVCFRSDGEE